MNRAPIRDDAEAAILARMALSLVRGREADAQLHGGIVQEMQSQIADQLVCIAQPDRALPPVVDGWRRLRPRHSRGRAVARAAGRHIVQGADRLRSNRG